MQNLRQIAQDNFRQAITGPAIQDYFDTLKNELLALGFKKTIIRDYSYVVTPGDHLYSSATSNSQQQLILLAGPVNVLSNTHAERPALQISADKDGITISFGKALWTAEQDNFEYDFRCEESGAFTWRNADSALKGAVSWILEYARPVVTSQLLSAADKHSQIPPPRLTPA